MHSVEKTPLFITMERDNIPIPTIHTLWKLPDMCELRYPITAQCAGHMVHIKGTGASKVKKCFIVFLIRVCRFYGIEKYFSYLNI